MSGRPHQERRRGHGRAVSACGGLALGGGEQSAQRCEIKGRRGPEDHVLCAGYSASVTCSPQFVTSLSHT
ncbi:MAG: hypothetical protein LC721_09050, partial [Actinobacteria bacterium]|nr:hypothetical protein [Actinomycetota bacterium]